jgi:hypothetical protein
MKRSQIDNNLELKSDIIEFVKRNNLDLDWVSNFKQIIYQFLNNLTEIPTCYCGNNNNFKSFRFGYRKTCSFNCSNSSQDKKEKIKVTKIEKYGDENYNNYNKMKITKLEKYGDENFNNRDKANITNYEKYGSKSPMSNKDVLEKSQKTKKEKYGNKCFNNSTKTKIFWKNIDKSFINEMIEKVRHTKNIKYGDSNFNNVEKMKSTKLEKYGFYFNNSIKMIQTKTDTGLIFQDKSDWKIYKKKVDSITRRNKKTLYENWNGNDYYDDEVIKTYLAHSHTHRFYPCIDHKISVFYGFNNNIDPEIIGDIDNLCITKRYLNSIKGSLIEEEFIKKSPPSLTMGTL